MGPLRMDIRLLKLQSICLLFAKTVIFLFILINNPDSYFRTLLVFIAMALLQWFRLWLSQMKDWVINREYLVFFDYCLVIYLQFTDASNYSQLIYFIITTEMILLFYGIHTFLFIGIGLLTLLATTCIKFMVSNYFDFGYMLPKLLEWAFYFLCITGVFYMYRNQLQQGDDLKSATAKLKKTNQKLNHTLEKLEEITALEERGRIAREIHDVVGHTLSTALIEMEAGIRLLNRDSGLARKKLVMAQTQTRKGLRDIKDSVRILKSGENLLPLKTEFELLIGQTRKHTGVFINYRIDDGINLSSLYRKTLYRAFQEGLTNGLMHGQSTAFDFSLCKKADKIIFLLKDNGIGCNELSLGFGLDSMKQRVEGMGGNFNIQTEYKNGFQIEIILPEESGNEEDKDSNSR